MFQIAAAKICKLLMKMVATLYTLATNAHK